MIMNEEILLQTHTWLRRYFGELPRAELNEVAAHLRHEEISSGDLLYRQGDVGDCMHFVLTGRLEVRLRDEYGNALAVTHLSGGDLVGELSVLTGNRRAADVVAIRDSIGNPPWDRIKFQEVEWFAARISGPLNTFKDIFGQADFAGEH